MHDALAYGIVYGLAGGLVFGLTTNQIVKRRTTPSEGIRRSLQRVSIGLLIVGVVGMRVGAVGEGTGGLMLGLAGGLGLVGWDLGRITPAEALRWSWRKARSAWVVGLAGGLAGGLAIALVLMLIGSTGPNPVQLGVFLFVFSGLVGGLAGGLAGGLVFGLTSEVIVRIRTTPNQRIRRSLRNTLISLLIGGLVGGLVCGLMGGLFGGLILGLQNGGFAVIKHYMLRFLMWRNDYAPLNYVRFLDYAAERVFLRKVGGGYIFTHRLLMEYFAALQPTDGARQTKTS